MKRSKKSTGWLAAILVGACAGAAALYLHAQGLIPPLSIGQESETAGVPVASPAPTQATPSAPAEPRASASAEEPSQPQIAATGEVAQPAKPMTVPSFDVVLVDPSGEGVLAGRAQPGWTVSLESGGKKVAATTGDAQGEWSIVLEKPLRQGNHSLSLKTISPDGTRALSSQQTVSVAVAKVGDDNTAPLANANEPASAESTGNMPVKSDATPATDATHASVEPTIQARAAGEQGSQQQTKPAITLSTVDYQDIGTEAGKLTVTGTADPGTQLSLYFDDEPVAKVTADRFGMWRIETDKNLGLGHHTFRAERYDQVTQKVAARATVTFERANPAPPPVVAETGKSESQVAALEASQEQTSGQDASAIEKAKVYVIRRGDTLWGIAKRYLGSGLLYSSIFQDNREVIRNPDLILPEQKVKMPEP
jgi:nucleoid-associated protein YgaU